MKKTLFATLALAIASTLVAAPQAPKADDTKAPKAATAPKDAKATDTKATDLKATDAKGDAKKGGKKGKGKGAKATDAKTDKDKAPATK